MPIIVIHESNIFFDLIATGEIMVSQIPPIGATITIQKENLCVEDFEIREINLYIKDDDGKKIFYLSDFQRKIGNWIDIKKELECRKNGVNIREKLLNITNEYIEDGYEYFDPDYRQWSDEQWERAEK